MNIEVTSYTQVSYWLAFFELLSNEELTPLWEILGVPPDIVSRPDPIVRVADAYIHTLSLTKEENNPFNASLEDVVESLRLDILSRLALAFAKVIDNYGLETAERLYSLADHAFVHPKDRYWRIWFDLLSGGIEINFPLRDCFVPAELKSIQNIVDRHLLTLKNQMELVEHISVRFLEENPTIQTAIEGNCAIAIWGELRSVFDNSGREELYQWGFKNVDHLISTAEWESMRSFCLEG